MTLAEFFPIICPIWTKKCQNWENSISPEPFVVYISLTYFMCFYCHCKVPKHLVNSLRINFGWIKTNLRDVRCVNPTNCPISFHVKSFPGQQSRMRPCGLFFYFVHLDQLSLGLCICCERTLDDLWLDRDIGPLVIWRLWVSFLNKFVAHCFLSLCMWEIWASTSTYRYVIYGTESYYDVCIEKEKFLGGK